MPRRNLYAIAAAVAVSACCWQATRGAKPKDEMMELYGTFVDAVEQVESYYVRPVNRKELLESALRGMLQDLDPHSQYINEAEWKAFKKTIEGHYGGIGIQVEMDQDSDRLRVIAPMVGTPAYQAGVLPGDLIMEIDGQSTEGFTPDKAVEVLTGRPGTPVKLAVRHEADGKVETLSMTRAEIDTPSVLGDTHKPDDQWDFMLDHDRKIGYVRISSFIQNTTDELKKALADLTSEGMKGLILDLRDNPGGLLSAAVEVSDLFVDEGVIVSTKGRNTPTKPYPAEKGSPYTEFPMVVLVNQSSASAAEIVSACLQDHKRAKVVGHRSYGKGSVQNILELEGGDSVLKLTVATYQRPSGKNIHRFKNAKDSDAWGVSPDPGLVVNLSPREYVRLVNARRKRDLQTLHGRRRGSDPASKADGDKPAAEKKEDRADGDKAKDKTKEAEKEKEKEKPKAKSAEKDEPFKDVQLEKALTVLKEEMDKSTARK